MSSHNHTTRINITREITNPRQRQHENQACMETQKTPKTSDTNKKKKPKTHIYNGTS
eukprot:m.81296 g.81296  ORF g.81296 m.81296 type:complete len:57 (-) comp14688_c0_seq3:54-224(-)